MECKWQSAKSRNKMWGRSATLLLLPHLLLFLVRIWLATHTLSQRLRCQQALAFKFLQSLLILSTLSRSKTPNFKRRRVSSSSGLPCTRARKTLIPKTLSFSQTKCQCLWAASIWTSTLQEQPNRRKTTKTATLQLFLTKTKNGCTANPPLKLRSCTRKSWVSAQTPNRTENRFSQLWSPNSPST